MAGICDKQSMDRRMKYRAKVIQQAMDKSPRDRGTKVAREAIAAFVDAQSGRLEHLLAQIEKKDGPLATWRCIMDLIEYHVPKLARHEMSGPAAGPIKVEVTWIDPD